VKTRAEKIADAEAAGLTFPHPDPPAKGEAIEVAPGILWARLPLPMALDHVNVYLLDGGDGWTIIDTGMKTREGRESWNALLAGPLAGKPIKQILVTHHHPDHIGLAGWLAEKVGAPLVTTRTAFLYAKMLQLDGWDDLPTDAVRYYQRAGFGPVEMERAQNRASFGFSKVCAPLPLGFHRIAAEDVLSIGGRAWRIVIGQGHAPEHAMLWCESDGILISGDQVLPRITSNIGVYPTEPEGDPLGEWLESCARLRDLLPSDLFVLPGHNEPFTGVGVRLTQLLDHHAETLAALEAFLGEPHTVIECFDTLFDRRITEQLQGFATVEAVAHLNHLVQVNRVIRGEESGVYRFKARSDQPAPA